MSDTLTVRNRSCRAAVIMSSTFVTRTGRQSGNFTLSDYVADLSLECPALKRDKMISAVLLPVHFLPLCVGTLLTRAIMIYLITRYILTLRRIEGDAH